MQNERIFAAEKNGKLSLFLKNELGLFLKVDSGDTTHGGVGKMFVFVDEISDF